MEGGQRGIIALTAEDYQTLRVLEDSIYQDQALGKPKWCPEKAQAVLPLLIRRLESLQAEWAELDAKVPQHRINEALFGNDPGAREIALQAVHVRYDLELTELRRRQYEASLRHGHKHEEVDAIKNQMRVHIKKWLDSRH